MGTVGFWIVVSFWSFGIHFEGFEPDGLGDQNPSYRFQQLCIGVIGPPHCVELVACQEVALGLIGLRLQWEPVQDWSMKLVLGFCFSGIEDWSEESRRQSVCLIVVPFQLSLEIQKEFHHLRKSLMGQIFSLLGIFQN